MDGPASRLSAHPRRFVNENLWGDLALVIDDVRVFALVDIPLGQLAGQLNKWIETVDDDTHCKAFYSALEGTRARSLSDPASAHAVGVHLSVHDPSHAALGA